MRTPTGEHLIIFLGFIGTILLQLKTSGDGMHHVQTLDFWIFVIAQLTLLVRGFYSKDPPHKDV